ncbi:MAG: hypothetical protein ABIP55_07695, partial [Tepidisphaeraceae bacterium]
MVNPQSWKSGDVDVPCGPAQAHDRNAEFLHDPVLGAHCGREQGRAGGFLAIAPNGSTPLWMEPVQVTL